jgi:hypothetical protein
MGGGNSKPKSKKKVAFQEQSPVKGYAYAGQRQLPPNVTASVPLVPGGRQTCDSGHSDADSFSVLPLRANFEAPSTSRSDAGVTRTAAAHEPATRTLQTDDPEMAARKAAYLAKKEEKKKRRREKSTGNEFLSKVIESEVDVQFSFSLIVIGDEAETSVQRACSSASASIYKEKDAADQESAIQSHGVNGQSKRGGGCLCMVNNPLVGKGVEEKDRFAKLSFSAKVVADDIPRCSDHLVTLSTAVVFLLRVDQPGFSSQLAGVATVVDKMRGNSHPKLRPVRAVVLCHAEEGAGGEVVSGNVALPSVGVEWSRELSEFESEHGELWKFGPIPMNGEQMHRVFAEIASVRICENHLADRAEGEMTTTTLDQLPPSSGMNLDSDEPNDDDLASPRHSEVSEGFQHPPHFDTEVDGSMCSESAMALHHRTFGVKSTPDLPTMGSEESLVSLPGDATP